MRVKERDRLVELTFAECMAIMQSKGKAYAGETDILANFRRNAERLGLAPAQVWLVYFAKHMDAIANAIKQSPDMPVDHSEGMTGRIHDGIVYLWLLNCLIERPFNVLGEAEPMSPGQRLLSVLSFQQGCKVLMYAADAPAAEDQVSLSVCGFKVTFLQWAEQFEARMCALAAIIRDNPKCPQPPIKEGAEIMSIMLLNLRCMLQEAEVVPQKADASTAR